MCYLINPVTALKISSLLSLILMNLCWFLRCAALRLVFNLYFPSLEPLVTTKREPFHRECFYVTGTRFSYLCFHFIANAVISQRQSDGEMNVNGLAISQLRPRLASISLAFYFLSRVPIFPFLS